MKILVTGAKGMLGQDLCPILEDENFEVLETDIDNLDITNIQNVEEILSLNKPDYVIHCAAYTAVEENQMLLAFSQLQQNLAEELPYISIAYRREAVFCSNQIGGVVSPTAFNVFDTIDQWTWNQS